MAFAGAASVGGGKFAHLQQAPLDPILGTKIMFDKDPSPKKVNLGIGAYRTDDGKPYPLKVVRKVEGMLTSDSKLNYEYLPINGDVTFCKLASRLLFGESPAWRGGRICTVQSLSGTGALRIGAEFIAAHLPGAKVFYSKPTWENHKAIFARAGVPQGEYRYWNAESKSLDIDGMLSDIRSAPRGSVILLHACAHNPTGVDPTPEQWRSIAEAVREGNHLPFFDCAYQGFATGDLDQDAWALRYFEQLGFNMLVCQSFAKNFGLYNERCGTFSVVCDSEEQARIVLSQVNLIIRPMYSNPPAHGALLISRILGDNALFQEWVAEMKGMSERIKTCRKLLYDALQRLQTPGTWTHIMTQIGMFSFTGLSPTQCKAMIEEHHVYMLTNGRISMAGVNTSNVEYLAHAIDSVVRQYP